MASYAHPAQRGFVAGRQGLQNVVDIDTRARIADILAGTPSYLFPLLLLFDFAAAFPSVAHRWLYLCLLYARVPPHVINFILAVYKNNIA